MIQGKLAPSMSMQEQARLFGLEFLDDSSLEPQWFTTREEYKPLLGGWRWGHASVVVDHDNEVQSIVVLGGVTKDNSISDSVILWDSSTKQWRQGPSLNEKRRFHAAETCNGKVYVIGGWNGNQLDTTECIDVGSLLANTDSSNRHWNTLSCRLSTARAGCAAVVVHDRYIVIMGGFNGSNGYLSTVEVLDTLHKRIVPLSGLTMNSPRSRFGAAVVGNSIYAVGGINNSDKKLGSVEVLTFNVDVDSIGDASTVFGKSSSWTMSKDLVLSKGRQWHAVAKIGNCVVVAGGVGKDGSINSVEVLDPYRHVVWHLPDTTVARSYCSIAVLSKNIVVLGGVNHASLETLALIDEQNTAKGMFSSRQEFDAEIEKLQHDVVFAQEEDRDISALEKDIEAERRRRRLEFLRRDQKFRTMQDMMEEIKFLSMEEISSLEDRLSIVKKNNALVEQFGPDEMCAIDESNVRGLSSKIIKEAKDETIVYPVMDDKWFERKSTESHQHVVTQLHKLGLWVSTATQKDIYLSLLDHINRWCRAKSENDWHSLRDVPTNDKKSASPNLENDGTDSTISKENRVTMVQDHEEKKSSITMRLQRLEGIVGRSFVRRLDLLEECCGIVNDETAGMKMEHRIAQLEQLLE